GRRARDHKGGRCPGAAKPARFRSRTPHVGDGRSRGGAQGIGSCVSLANTRSKSSKMIRAASPSKTSRKSPLYGRSTFMTRPEWFLKTMPISVKSGSLPPRRSPLSLPLMRFSDSSTSSSRLEARLLISKPPSSLGSRLRVTSDLLNTRAASPSSARSVLDYRSRKRPQARVDEGGQSLVRHRMRGGSGEPRRSTAGVHPAVRLNDLVGAPKG